MTKRISESEINRRTELAKILSKKIDERQLTQFQADEPFREGIIWKSLKSNIQLKAISNKYLEKED